MHYRPQPMSLLFKVFLGMLIAFLAGPLFVQRTSSSVSMLSLSAPTAALDLLAGTWQHQRDSGGWKVLAGGRVTLRLDKNGQAALSASAPNQAPLIVQGTWSLQGGLVTINVPGQFEISRKPYQLNGDTLTLPSQLSNDDPGSSTWAKVVQQPLDLIFVAFNRAVEEGDSGAEAAEKAAAEARKLEGVESVQVQKGGFGLEIIVKPKIPGGKKSRAHVLFATKRAPFITPVQRKAPASPLAGDPRSHIDALNPAGDPDTPTSKTAVVIAPFYSKPYVAYAPEVWAAPKGKQKKLLPAEIAKPTTFKEWGEDPNLIAKKLTDAGYDVELLVDDKATPGPIFRALQKRPSIVYYSTHGYPGVGESGLGAAGFLGTWAFTDDKGYKRPGFMKVSDFKENLGKLLDAEGVPEEARAGIEPLCAQTDKDIGFVFPVLFPKFFEVALGKKGLSDSFVYLDSCFSAETPALAFAFKPKAFIGSEGTVAGWATARFSQYIFSNMVRHGHSVREAVERLRQLCKGAYVINLEDSVLSPIARGDVDLGVESEHLKAWGINQESYAAINKEVLALMRMARWANKDVNNGAESLGRCFNLFWKTPGKRPGLGETFCTQGIIGSYTPTGPDVEDARHLVSGHPPKPIGRFVIR